MGTLYLVATPIGNLEDISVRAKRLLQEVAFVACEDTRHTAALFHKLALKSPLLISYYEENELNRIPQIVTRLRQGQDGALVSDAGTPTISDPGYKLVRECLKNELSVVSIPGPAAFLTALTASGLPTDKFVFLGYLPEKTGKKEKLLEHFASLPITLIFYEAPHRLIKTLNFIYQILGDVDLVVANELTKKFEKFYRDKISNLISFFEKNKPRGEYVILFHSHGKPSYKPNSMC